MCHYLAIKLHIEYHYALTSEIIMNVDNFEGANFTNEWAWKKLAETATKIKIFVLVENSDA